MNAFIPYLAALHQRNLLEEAGLARIARRAQLANQDVPAWRRILAAGARSLSGLFESAARTINPSIDCVDGAAA